MSRTIAALTLALAVALVLRPSVTGGASSGHPPLAIPVKDPHAVAHCCPAVPEEADRAVVSQAAAQPPFGDRLFKSGPIQVTADGRWVWAVNQHSDTVSRLDTREGAVTTVALPEPTVRDGPRALSVTEDGTAVWVSAHDSDRVYVLDGADGTVVDTVALPWGSGPYGIALSRPDETGRQRWALVALHRAAALAVIETETRAVTLLEPVFRAPLGVAWVEDAPAAWVTHLYPDGEHGRLTRVSTADGRPRVTSEITAFAATPRHSGRLMADDDWKNVAEGGYLNFRGHPAQIPSAIGVNQLWLPTQYHNMHTDALTPDTVIQASLRKLELDTRELSQDDKIVLTAKQVHDPTRGDSNPPWLGYGWDTMLSGAVDIGFAALNDGGRFGLVVGEQSDRLVVFPWDTAPIRSRDDPDAPGLPAVAVGARPLGVAVSPTAPRAYVYNDLSADISVVDLTRQGRPIVAETIALPDAAPTDLLADPEVRRGAELFFTSDDRRLSANGKVSCASCHLNGEHDGRTWGFEKLPPGTMGQGHGPRSTPSLLGLGRGFPAGARDPEHGWGLLHRSGDRDEVQDFEHTITGPLMGGDGFLGPRANDELGAPNAGLDADLDALAAFVLAQPPLERSPHRAADGTLTEAATRGATMFLGGDPAGHRADADCASCHVPETGFEDGRFHDVGARRPEGEHELNDSARRGDCLWCANTPSLVGAWDTAPYDGVWRWASTMIGTLDDFAAYEDRPARHGHVERLTGRQLRDLAAFVRSIDGAMTANEVRGARDDVRPRITRVAPTSLTRLEVWFSETVDPETAADPAHYRVTRVADGQAMPVTDAAWDDQNGDRVTLTTALEAAADGIDYRLTPTDGIHDVADWTSGGRANAVDPADPRNEHTFTLGETLTVTLGASGYEHLTVRVHDAAPVGPGLRTWSHDHVALADTPQGAVPGFVRFEWQAAFAAATGIDDAAAITGAALTLRPFNGDAGVVELRRTLQPWADPLDGGDWNASASGAPTWRDHAHPDGRWNEPGAAALGGTGRQPSDYDGRWDLAEAVDAVVEMPAINEPLVLDGADVTDAFRFWFDRPALDYGHALRLRPAAPVRPVARFQRWEAELHQHGPTLTLTYRLPTNGGPAPTAVPTEPPNAPAPGAAIFIPVGWR